MTNPDPTDLLAALEEARGQLALGSYKGTSAALDRIEAAYRAQSQSDRSLCARTLEKAAEVAENPTGVWWHGYDSLNDAIAAEIRALAKEG